MKYKDYLKTEDWRLKRFLKRLNKDRCSICSSLDRLDVHHLNYRNLYNVKLSDLRVLCRRCHFLAHDLHKQSKMKFRSTDHNSRFTILKHAVKKELGIQRINMFKK